MQYFIFNSKGNMRNKGKKIIILGFWLMVWELFTRVVDNSFLLVGPMETFRHILLLMEKASFFKILSFSSSRILFAYFLAFFQALALALFSYRHRLFENLIQPPLFLLRSLPVASFVIILLFFIGRANLSFFISFWMSFPIFYFNFLEGMKKLDKELLEMAKVFRLSFGKRFRYILIPGIYPQILSGAKLAMGLSWKSGIAAELIGQVRNSIGYQLMDAKVSLEMGEVFAWSMIMILLSKFFELLILFVLKKGFSKGSV